MRWLVLHAIEQRGADEGQIYSSSLRTPDTLNTIYTTSSFRDSRQIIPTWSSPLEILLPKNKPKPPLPWLRVLVTLQREISPEPLGPAEEHARLAGAVQFLDAAEDHVPVWAAEVRGCDQSRDGVAVFVVQLDVQCVAVRDLRC
jgi:hypothetical protein